VDERPLEPGVEPVRIAEATQLAPGDHQRLLHGILGQADIAEDAARDAIERVAAGTGQDGERLLVSTLGLLDEIAIHSLRPQRWRLLGAPSEPTESTSIGSVQSSLGRLALQAR
jgi:hypothetical protein